MLQCPVVMEHGHKQGGACGDEKVLVESNSLSADNLTTPWTFFYFTPYVKGKLQYFFEKFW